MKDYLLECIDVFENLDGEITEKANTPAKGNLFEINESSNSLEQDKTEAFHHIVSKLLYVSKRARIELDLAVSFLRTRV